MNKCKNCGKTLDKETTFCTNCGSKVSITEKKVQPKNNDSKKKSKKIPIILIILGLIVLGGILGKDSIMYNYYVFRADKESSIYQAIDYYKKALKVDYNKGIVNKINEKIKNDEKFEKTLDNLDGVVKGEDLQKMYLDIYVRKAKENFNNKNYETTWNYLDKAQSKGYDIESFEYYGDLVKIKEEPAQKELNANTDSNLEYLDHEYIIPESSVRYLSREELTPYTKEELGYIRNEIFARHGYVFNSKEYNDYFNRMSWYIPDVSFRGNESDLNPIERENVKLIKSLENE